MDTRLNYGFRSRNKENAVDEKKSAESEEQAPKPANELKEAEAQQVAGGTMPDPVNPQITDS